MVVVQRLVQASVAGKAAIVLIVANEVRGSVTALAAWRSYRLHGPTLAGLWLLPLLIAPPLALWAWRAARRRQHIAARLNR